MSESFHVLLIDNYDSFTFNLVDELRKLGVIVDVWRNDIAADAALELALSPRGAKLIVLSPGPGRPAEAGCCERLIRLASGKVPIFGVCLGLQAIVEAYGGEVGSAGEVVHGKTALVSHQGEGIFSGLPSPLQVGRYHSLVATRLSPDVEAIAHAGSLVMAVRHRDDPVIGVQFHPESILTPRGAVMLEQVVAWAKKWEEEHAAG
jgi:anthranilate synthase/aminodeoxychorismate synthase-like glutamine amidotransferase